VRAFALLYPGKLKAVSITDFSQHSFPLLDCLVSSCGVAPCLLVSRKTPFVRGLGTKRTPSLGLRPVRSNWGFAMSVRNRAEMDFTIRPKVFVFMDKTTGAKRFEVKARADGRMPVDVAASVLAVHCMIRNQLPNDFTVMVAAGEKHLHGIKQQARKLMRACPLTPESIQLTNRQQEVLRGVQQGMTNKAIGVKLNISARTVKFHVAALLVKFDVAGRRGLMWQATSLLSPVNTPRSSSAPQLCADKDRGIAKEPGILGMGPARIVPLERRSRG
jgi:DNA-binding NarL/FixJ family response regulator